MTAKPAHRTDPVKKLASLIRGIRVAMLTTIDGPEVRSRPMAALEAPFDGTLWFFTRRDAPKVDEVRQDQRVNVTFADPEGDRYVSLSGRASIVRDPSKNSALWSPALLAWFPAGPEDRDLALMQIHVDQAESWDPHASAMVTLYELPRARKPLEAVRGITEPRAR